MKKQHANILLGIIGIVAVLGILMASAGAWYFFKTIHRTTADEQGAAAAFNDARATFKGAMPLIELRPGGPVLTRPLPGVGPSTKLHTLHYLAWNRENQRLTRADIPFALLRLKEGPVDLMRYPTPAGYPMERVVAIRISDIERAGPALLFARECPTATRS